MRQSGYALQYAATAIKANGEVVLVAVQQSGEALRYAAAPLKASHGIVLAAVQTDGLALRSAAAALKADPEIVLAAVRQNGWALEFAAATLKADRGIVMAAARQSCAALRSRHHLTPTGGKICKRIIAIGLATTSRTSCSSCRIAVEAAISTSLLTLTALAAILRASLPPRLANTLLAAGTVIFKAAISSLITARGSLTARNLG